MPTLSYKFACCGSRWKRKKPKEKQHSIFGMQISASLHFLTRIFCAIILTFEKCIQSFISFCVLVHLRHYYEQFRSTHYTLYSVRSGVCICLLIKKSYNVFFRRDKIKNWIFPIIWKWKVGLFNWHMSLKFSLFIFFWWAFSQWRWTVSLIDIIFCKMVYMSDNSQSSCHNSWEVSAISSSMWHIGNR